MFGQAERTAAMEIELRKGALRALVETIGGELVSLRDGEDREYIWGGDPAFWTGRNPVLFPVVGSLKDGKTAFGGKTYEMGRHGFARRSEFSMAERGVDFVVFRLRESADTLAQYPFPFSLKVRHRLLDDGFETAFTVENTGSGPMPFCVGAHTAFRCPLTAEERFEDYRIVFGQPEALDSHLLNPAGILQREKTTRFMDGGDSFALDYEVFRQVDTMIFDGLRSKTVRLVGGKSGRGVEMAFDGFPMLAFWTKPGAEFICLEPWQGCAAFDDESGEFTDKPYCVTLDPEEKKTLAYQVRLLK